MDARLIRLLAKDEIRGVIFDYCRGIDRHDLELVRRCYHPDATDEHGSFSGGVDAYLEWVGKLLARYRFTMHSVSNLHIEFGDDAKRPNNEVAAVETYGVSIHRGRDATPQYNLATGFRFIDRFESRDGLWKIASRVAVSEWSVSIPEEAWWSIPDSLRQGQRDSSDALYALLSAVGVPSSPRSD